MITLNSGVDNSRQLPDDKISNKEILALLNIGLQEFSKAKKWRPEDFPKGVRSGQSIYYSKKEVIDFFGKYGYTPKDAPVKPTIVAAKLR